MSDSKLLKMYLDIIGGRVRFCSGDIVTIEYDGTVDIYDSYLDLLYYVKLALKEAGKYDH